PAHLLQQFFPGGHVAAADEDGRALQVLRAAREDGPVDQVAHLLRLDAAVAENLVGTGVDGHDTVEDAWLWVAVNLDENLAFVHDSILRGEHVRPAPRAPCVQGAREEISPAALVPYFGEKGCLAVSFLLRTSSIFGSFFMARWIASLVAS